MPQNVRLTPETSKALLDSLRAGSSKTKACKVAGITRTTLHFWRKRGERGEAGYATFVASFAEALKTGEQARLAAIDASCS